MSDGVHSNTLEVIGIDEVGVAIAVCVPEAHLESSYEVCDDRQSGSIVATGLGLSLVATPPRRGGRVVRQPGDLVNQVTVAHTLARALESLLAPWDCPQVDVELAVGDDALDTLERTSLLEVPVVLGGCDVGSVGAHVEHEGAKQCAVDLAARVRGATGRQASSGEQR